MTQLDSNTFKTSEATRARNKRWRDAHPEQMKAIRAKWLKNNLEYDKRRRAEYGAKWRKANPTKAKARLEKWKANNQKHIKAYRKKYYAEHREERLVANNKWNADNRERTKLVHKKYRQNKKTEIKLLNAARRAKVAGGGIRKEDIENWNSRICGVCKLPIEENYHIDHITPLSRGGLHVVSNLQLAHPRCNILKGDRLTNI